MPYGVLNGRIVDAKIAQTARDVIEYAAACDAADSAKAELRAEIEAEVQL
jgi:hypothetical protein